MAKKKNIHRDMLATKMLKTINEEASDAHKRGDSKSMERMKYLNVLAISMSLRVMALEKDLEECISKKLEWIPKPKK